MQIITAIVNALNGPGAPCKYWRMRQDEFQPADLPAGNVMLEDETGEIDAGEYAGILGIGVDQIVGQSLDEVDEAIDALLLWTHQAIMADQTLGGLAVYIDKKQIKWYLAQKGAEQCVAAARFDIHFRTALTDSTNNQS